MDYLTLIYNGLQVTVVICIMILVWAYGQHQYRKGRADMLREEIERDEEEIEAWKTIKEMIKKQERA